MRHLMITVDVEAQPARAERDHVDRLIWGKYPKSRGGIGEMMDIGDRYGTQIVMFLDYCERALYGEEIIDVAREIHRRGHDLQLHSHPEFLAQTFWTKKGLTPPDSTNTASDEQADALLEYLCSSQEEAGAAPPVGYRGGGYRYGPSLLRSMVRHGVKFNSSYNAARENQPLKLGRIRQFYWDNGCLEVPISCVNPYRNLTRNFDINFNAGAFRNADQMVQCLEAFYQQMGEDAIAVMVMHSWSFCKIESNGFFSPPLPENIERFEEFLSHLKPAGVEVVNCSQALDLVAMGRCEAGPIVPIETVAISGAAPIASPLTASSSRTEPGALISVDKSRPVSLPPAELSRAEPISARPELRGGQTMTQTLGTSPAAWTATSASDGATEPCCSVCQTSLSCFEDYNGRPKSRCPQCGSVERQRVFVQIYDSFLQEEFNLSEKHILALSPSKSENIIYAQRKIFNVVSCDVQPHLKTDIVADITNMPNVESAAYDSVIASYVMTCVHDLDSALSEIHRVLKPGGRFLFCDPLTFNSETVEHTDIATITNWYGQETYNRYKVGSFRRLGDVGLLKALAAHGFLVKTFYGRDPITKSKWVWHSAQKDAGATATGVGETMFDTKAMSERAEKLWSANKYAEALNLHRQALENGSDTVSTYRLGTAYLLGFGTPRDIEKAWEYLSKPSQEQGRYACYFRGVILATPDFSAFDPVRAFACFERAAELGVPEAQAELNKLKS